MLKISLDKINELFKKISETDNLFLPLLKAGEVNFGLWDEEKEICLNKLKTVKSAKDAFFPQSEDLMGFKTEKKNISVLDMKEDVDPFVIFGVRACDCASFDNVLDRVFLSEPVDTYYKKRREMGTIITLACNEPEETCFCHTFGIDPAEPKGDISCWILGNDLYWNPNTEKGNDLTIKVKALLCEADEKEVQKKKEEIKNIVENLPLYNLTTKDWDKVDLLTRFNDELWADLSKGCIGCGTCTFVCPTCQCYDIRDYDTGNGIVRYRCWDSCMFSDFTRMAHGNPRKSQVERYRQRFMHKLVYFPENNNNEYSCVGCGRCVEKCPMNLNIVKVIKAFGGNK